MPDFDINDFLKQVRETERHDAAARSMRKFSEPPQTELAHEVAMLRRELAKLRADLIPPHSAILTGPEVARAYSKLRGAA